MWVAAYFALHLTMTGMVPEHGPMSNPEEPFVSQEQCVQFMEEKLNSMDFKIKQAVKDNTLQVFCVKVTIPPGKDS